MKIWQGLIICVLVLGAASIGHTLEKGKFGITANGRYYQPIGLFGDRFDGIPGGQAGLYYRWKDRFRIEWTVEYLFADKDWHFTETNAATQNIDHQLRIGNIMWNWQLLYNPEAQWTPYLEGGVGYVYTEYTRGVFVSQGATWGSIHIVDWTMGTNIGLGLLFNQKGPVQFYGNVLYHLVLTELWPTVAINMEKVNPIHSASLGLGVRYIF